MIPSKFIACGTAAFLIAALSVQAQATNTSASSQLASSTSSAGATSAAPMSSAQSNPDTQSAVSPSATSSTSAQAGSAANTANASAADSQSANFSGSAAGSAAGSLSASGSTNTSLNDSMSATAPSSSNATEATANSNANSNANSIAGSTNNTQSNVTRQNNVATQNSVATQNNVATTTTQVSDAQVTTFVQHLDAQGPAVVQQATTVVGDLACSDDTVANLVEALHSGKSVTITSEVNGQKKSSTFNASGTHLGYGEAYISLALAAQELRNAGITSCATPDQWQAVLLGGPITGTTAVASSSTQFPGIVTLHTQGQGWGQIAQTTNVQLGQVITSSNSGALAPTGFSSSDMDQGRVKADEDKDNGEHKGHKKHWWSLHKDKDETQDARNPNAATPSPNSDK